MKFFVQVMLLCLSTVLVAQTQISGTVTDKDGQQISINFLLCNLEFLNFKNFFCIRSCNFSNFTYFDSMNFC